MKTYVGTKLVGAEPMTKDDFNTRAGQEVDLVGQDEPGYLVRYELGPGETVHYQSWSPKEVFELCYREVDIKAFDE